MWAWSLMAGQALHLGDSVGVKIQGDQSFILYQISQGETIFSVSRKYNLPFAAIVDANPGVDLNKVDAGQTILVPQQNLYTTTASNSNTKPSVTPAKNSANQHLVLEGETLYSISRAYNIDFSEILNANPNLKDYNINAGQYINLPASTLASVSTGSDYSASTSSETLPVNTNNNEKTDLPAVAEGNNMLLTSGKLDKSKSFAQIYSGYTGSDYVPHIGKGVATWIEGSSEFGKNSERFYALHNNAPIGSVVKVRNLMNNRVIYAKVIGTLSDSEVNEKVLVKLSAGAADQLNVLDNRFVAEIQYFTIDEDFIR